MKNRDIIKNINNLIKLQNEQAEMIKNNPLLPRLPLKISLAINRNKQKMVDEYKIYEKTLNQYLKDNGVINGNFTSLELDTQQKLQEQINELQNEDVNIDIVKFNEVDFKDYTPTLEELDILSFMIE